jgi:hypothetical protein
MTMGSNTINEQWALSDALLAVIETEGFKADDVADEGELFWQLAASVARIPNPTEKVRGEVIGRLRDRERCPNPFQGFPQDGGPF